jgi:hypothetical protein
MKTIILQTSESMYFGLGYVKLINQVTPVAKSAQISYLFIWVGVANGKTFT